jgi:hypothetical protein
MKGQEICERCFLESCVHAIGSHLLFSGELNWHYPLCYQTFHCYDKYLKTTIQKEKGFILVYTFRGFSSWSADSIDFCLRQGVDIMQRDMVDYSCLHRGGQERGWGGERERERREVVPGTRHFLNV